MKKHISTIIAILVFITGLSLLLYPTVSNYWNSLYQTRVVANYSDTMAKMNEQDKKAAIDAASNYNSSLVTNAGRFTPSDSELSLYKSLLNADGTGMMGYIVIPEIQCKLAIYHTVDDSVLQIGVGHLSGSSLPVGGKSTHCVLSSHRGLPSAKLFTELDRLKKGDVFYLHVYDQVLTYEVDNIAIVEPNDYGLLEIEEGQDLCTLFTCTPYGINTQRLLVRGHRIENTLGVSSLTSDAAKVNSLVVASCVGIVILSIGFIVRSYEMERKIKNCIICFIVLFFMGVTTVKADTFGSLVVSCPIENVSVSLYRVADTEMNLVSPFSKYSVSLKEEDLNGVANILENHILKDHIQPDYTSDSVFSNLELGIYLIVPSGNDEYVFQPSLVSITSGSEITSELKYEKKESLTSLHVLKTWKNDSKKKRPTSISVDLLQTDANGETSVIDKQVLSSDNAWSYTWDHLSSLYSYRVLESKVPSGYTESVVQEKNTVVLTNTANKTITDKKKTDKELPLTGQLWWPVPVLLFVGMSLFGLGKYLR